MGLRTTLALLVALSGLAASPEASCLSGTAIRPARIGLQEDKQTAPAASGQEPTPAAAPEQALSPEDRETLEHLRSVLADEGRDGARELLRVIVAELAEPEAGGEAAHVDLLLQLDRVAKELGSLKESLRLRESLVVIYTRLLPPDHRELLAAKQSLAVTRQALGDLAGAKELKEAVLEARTRLLPPDHPELLAAKQGLSVTRHALGDLAGAKELAEAVLEAHTRLLSADHPDLLSAKQNLAVMRSALGDLAGARELEEAVLEARTRLLPPDDPDLLASKLNLAGTRYKLGDLSGARALFEAVLEAFTRLLPADHPHLLAAKLNLAVMRSALGDLAGAKELEEAVLEARARLLPPDHPELLDSKQNLAVTRMKLGDLAGAKELLEAVHEARVRLLPPDHPELLSAKQNLAATRNELGDPTGAKELEEAVLEARTRLLPPDHPDLLRAKVNLAMTLESLGDLTGARELVEAVHEAWTRLLPPDHPELLKVKVNLAIVRKALGDLAGAKELEEAVLEAWTRLLPPDHPDLRSTKQNLAVTRKELGDLAGAKELEEAVLEARTRLLPPDHPDLLGAKVNLANTRNVLRDFVGARELFEAVLETGTSLLPEDNPFVLGAKLGLAVTRKELGDLVGARELEEAVLEAQMRLLPADHPDLLTAMQNLAGTWNALGDFTSARELYEAVLEARTRFLPPDHPDLLLAKQNVAVTRHAFGDVAGAKELDEIVLEARTRLLPPDHPDLLAAKLNLAATRNALGDFAGARDLYEAVLEARTRLLPPDHPDLLGAKENLALTRWELGDLEGARELVGSLLAGVRLRASALRAEGVRSAREGAWVEFQRLSKVFHSSTYIDPEHALEPDFFATFESLRMASVASADMTHARVGRPELAKAARGVAEIRSRLNDLAAAGPRDAASAENWRAELLRLSEERDRAERGLRRKLTEAGVLFGEVDARGLGAHLAPGTGAVSFLRYTRWFEKRLTVDSLLAFVVQPGGVVARIELGPTAELAERVGAWRAALGRPLAGRGIAGSDDAADEEALDRLGTELRARILDPILAVTGKVRKLHVVLDDVLFLVPLDALPDGDGLVGERLMIRNEVTLARLLRDASPIPSGGRLVLAGGLDYDADFGAEASVHLDAATPPVGGSLERSGASLTSFVSLPGTTAEVESIGRLFEATLEGEVTPLTGAGGTKGALVTNAPKARFLHLATHGWFASESFKSQLDTLAEQSARDAFQRAEETLTGFAPETLCGLALAGANRGRDALGHVPGILTAEELASFDLRNCELAVLSACETNVGIRRAGQGIQSLQTALHAAGARTAITSLWKVDDAATRRLFELFYTKLWKDRLGKADALWQAKMALRAEGHPPRDWAGWVLSGDPE